MKSKASSEQITLNKFHSYCTGALSDGCKMCVKGKKMVLFITGLCPQKCFYCPVSEDKFGKDLVFANEWQITDLTKATEMIEECKLTQAHGCGITGGDPLVKIDRTCNYIKMLKSEFGDKFHIHLYTPMTLVNEKNLKMLFDAGLDEIRFHPNLDDNKDWYRITLAQKYKWNIGVEIPIIPGYQEKTKKLMDFIEGKVEFLNLNELEFSDTNASHYKLDKMKFKQKDSISYGVLGSESLGKKLISHSKKKNYTYRVHLCTAKLKNMVQMGNRLKIRAKNISNDFDIVTKEGFLRRGAAYLKGFEPGFDYLKRLDARDKSQVLELIAKAKILEKNVNLKLDLPRMRILLSTKDARKLKKELKSQGLIPAIVKEYPTSDLFTLELDFI